VSFAGIDLLIASGDANLVEIPAQLPPVLPGEEPLLRISGVVPVLEGGKLWHAHLLRPMTLAALLGVGDTAEGNRWKKIDVLASSDFADGSWETIRARSPGSLPRDRLLVADFGSSREAVWRISQPRAVAVPLWSLPRPVTLGAKPSFFGTGDLEGGSHSEEFHLAAWSPSAPGEVSARIVLFGIGPGSRDSSRQTSLVINGNSYELLRHAPFTDLEWVDRWQSRYLVPLEPKHLHRGLNRLELRAGEVPAPGGGGGIELDDVRIERLDLFHVQRSDEAPAVPDLG
jgi:hypothetical protein